MMAVFTLVFARLGQMPSGGAPYPLFAFAALVPWFFFSNSVNSGTMSLVTYRNIVTKTYFPREIVPIAQVGSRLVDLAAASTLFAVLLVYYNVHRPVERAGAAVYRAADPVHAGHDARDVGDQRVLPRREPGRADRSAALAVSDAGGVPVVRGSGRVPAVFLLNPLTGVVEGLRAVLVFGRAPEWDVVAISASLIVAIFIGALVLFKKTDKYFADVI